MVMSEHMLGHNSIETQPDPTINSPILCSVRGIRGYTYFDTLGNDLG